MKALYRKYRPLKLGDVVGQDQITLALKNSLKSGKISHSYIFTGPRGTGKTSIARIFAHEINNFPYTLEDSYLDIIEIDAASNTGVDNIRDLREKALIAPTKGKYKVYIIDEVHMLSKSAFNALLKTLEEPPEHVVFILATTDLEKVPVTITSRSQVHLFRLADPALMFSHLKNICDQEKINISDPALKVIVRRGGGSFRDSLSLLDQISSLAEQGSEISEKLVSDCLGLPLDGTIEEILSAYKNSDTSTVSSLLKDLFSQGLKPELIAESILEKLVSFSNPADLIIFSPLLEKLPSVSAPFPDAKLLLALVATTPLSSTPRISGGDHEGPMKETIVRREAISSEQSSKGELSLSLERSKKTPRRSGGDHEGAMKEAIVGREAFSSELVTNHDNFDNISPSSSSSRRPEVLGDRERDRVKSCENYSASSNRSEEKASRPNTTAISPAIKNQLSSCKIIEENGLIHVYPMRKITKTILEKPLNHEILKGYFEKEFIIHSPDELEKDPKLSKISDIMGNVQEVNENGGIPF